MKTKIIGLLGATVLASLLTGCSTMVDCIPIVGDITDAIPATVVITSDPPNAEVDVTDSDDKRIFQGKTPANLKLDDDIYVIEVKLDGYKPYKESRRIWGSSQPTINVQLERDTP